MKRQPKSTDAQLLRAVWSAMVSRCHNRKNKQWGDYGRRGLTVCDEWRTSFDLFAFWARENGYHHSLCIDRINNDDGYKPGNCRWVDHKVNNRNSRHCRMVTVGSVKQPLTAWLEDPKCVIAMGTFYQRIGKGWSDVQALLTPPTPRNLRRSA
jgi:hypothetical protein